MNLSAIAVMTQTAVLPLPCIFWSSSVALVTSVQQLCICTLWGPLFGIWRSCRFKFKEWVSSNITHRVGFFFIYFKIRQRTTLYILPLCYYIICFFFCCSLTCCQDQVRWYVSCKYMYTENATPYVENKD